MDDLIRRSDVIKAFCMDCKGQGEPCEHSDTCKTMKVLRSRKKIPAVESCKDTVSKEWMLNEFVTHAYDIIYDINSHEKGMSLTGIKQVIESAPSVTVEPKHGEWIDIGGYEICKNCYEVKRFPHWSYCPNCGEKMFPTQMPER